MDTSVQALKTYQMHIGGEWVDAASGETFETYDPYTAQPWALIPRGNEQDVDRAVEAAHQAFTTGDWPEINATQRGAMLRKLGDLLSEHADHLAEIEVRDNGKLIAEMNLRTARKHMRDGTLKGGMIPKVETCISAIIDGVEAAAILDGRVAHAILLEIFTEHGVGTLIR